MEARVGGSWWPRQQGWSTSRSNWVGYPASREEEGSLPCFSPDGLFHGNILEVKGTWETDNVVMQNAKN